MKIEDQIFAMLSQTTKPFLSGEELAQKLHVSRGAVWKAIERLRQRGIEIGAISHQGYWLADTKNLRPGGIRRELFHQELKLQVEKSVASTNTVVKQWAEQGAPEGCVLLAEEQTAGKGRMGRKFYSPPGTGLYISILLRPTFSPNHATRITTAAAVAVAQAIETVTGEPGQIKWVNDVYCHGKKVCGILTEAALDLENRKLQYAIPGIGINVFPPPEGFPEELQTVAGAILPRAEKNNEVRTVLAARVLDNFFSWYSRLTSQELFLAYRERCFILGKQIVVLRNQIWIPAKAMDLDRNFGLKIRWEDGQEETLFAGEVSIRAEGNQ